MSLFVPPSSASPRPPAVLRYGVALGTLTLAVVNAWYGGLHIGLLTALGSLLLTNYFLIPSFNTFELGLGDILRGTVFLFVAGLISWPSEARRRAEAQTYAQAERFYVTLASIGDAMIATDALGKVTFLNTVAEQLTGWPLADAIGKDIANVFYRYCWQTHPKHREQCSCGAKPCGWMS